MNGPPTNAYAPTQAPSYASAAASGRGLYPNHLDVTSASGLTAYRAGPRRDPLSHQMHVHALAATGRPLKAGPAGPYAMNMVGTSLVVAPHASWEADINEKHSNRAPLMPAVGSQENKGRYDGVLGSGAAGAAHPHLGLFGQPTSYGGGGMGVGPPPPTSPHFGRQTSGYSEEAKRQFLLTGERARRGAHQRWAPTNTIGAYVPVPQPPPAPLMAAPGGVAPSAAFATPQHLAAPLPTPGAPQRQVHWGYGSM